MKSSSSSSSFADELLHFMETNDNMKKVNLVLRRRTHVYGYSAVRLVAQAINDDIKRRKARRRYYKVLAKLRALESLEQVAQTKIVPVVRSEGALPSQLETSKGFGKALHQLSDKRTFCEAVWKACVEAVNMP